jgi:hypothetical protein
MKGLHFVKRPENRTPLCAISVGVPFRRQRAFPTSESEINNRREEWAKNTDDLRRRRYLPVVVWAQNTDVQGIHLGSLDGVYFQVDSLFIELQISRRKPEVLSAVYESLKVWDRKCELIKEGDLKLLEARGSDPRKKCFQVSADAFERKPAKVRKCDRSHDWPN